MKTNQKILILLFAVFMFTTFNLFAQKTIITKDGQEIPVKKYRLRLGIIEYKTLENPRDGFQSMDFDNLYYIKHKKNKGIAFHQKGRSYTIKKMDRLSEMQLRGAVDACKYSKFPGPIWGTLVPSFLIMPVGLGTAIGVSSTKPRKNLVIPDNEYINNPEYLQAYKDQAFKCKKQVTWMAFTSGFAMALAVVAVISAL